jgi:hypothetical protein
MRDVTSLPTSRGLSDAELDAIALATSTGELPAREAVWLRSIRDEWHRRGLHKRFDEER